MFSYVSLEERVPKDHPLRAVRQITDRAVERLSPRFDALYVHFGRPSVAPEKLLRALLLQALYTIRSERGPVRRVFGRGTRTRRRRAAVIRRSTFMASGAPTRRITPPPTPMHGSTKRPVGARPGWAIWATCCSSIGPDSLSTPASRRRMGTGNAMRRC